MPLKTLHRGLLYVALVVCITISDVVGQAPQITSLSTYSAPLHSTLTITGSNFSSTLSENRVFFGSIESTVQSATSTVLTVTVPPGIDLNFVKVIVNGLTGFSPKPFSISFSGSGAVDPESFKSPQALSGSLNVFLEQLLADVNGDGKLDIVGRKEASMAFVVSVNTSDFSTGAVSFADPVVFNFDSYPRDIQVADIDGDGRSEVLILKNSTTATGNYVTIFKNNSSGGFDENSFDAGVDFPTITDPEHFYTADLDLDGKPDILVTSESGVLGIQKNSIQNGVIDASSLAIPTEYTMAGEVVGVQTGDLNGDAKPEILFSTHSSNASFYVLRNNTAQGAPFTSSSFASPQSFGSGADRPSAVIDINGDSKPDVIGLLNAYINSTTSADISFANPVDVYTGPGVIHPIISDHDGNGLLDILHVGEFNGLSAIRIKSENGLQFSRSVNLNIPIAASINSADLNGDGKPDLLLLGGFPTKLHVVVNQNSPLPDPSISSVLPSRASAGSRVTIIGANFGSVYDNNIVTLNGQPISVVGGNTTSLNVVLPYPVMEGYFEVRANGVKDVTTTQFLSIITAPVIDTFSPKVAPANSHIVISGANFHPAPEENTVFFGAVKAEVVQASATTLQVKVPPGASYSPISVTVNGLTGRSVEPFTLSFPEGKPLSKHSFRQFTLRTSTNAWPIDALKLADIDLDGKTDIIVSNDRENAVTIYRNISTTGQLSKESFAPPLSLPTGAVAPNSVQVGDLDGDGKPDLAVLKSNYIISIYKNVSIPGGITSSSFEPPFDLPSGSLYRFVIEDMDSDGKMDIVFNGLDFSGDPYVNGVYKFSIMRNLSQPGILNVSSFDTPKTLLWPYPKTQHFVISDINGDHRPDILATNGEFTGSADYDLYAFENTSLPGTLQFANGYFAKYGIHGMRDLSTGDLNYDGIIDIIAVSSFANKSYIFHSATPLNSIPATNLTETSLMTNAIRSGLGDIDGDGKADLILVNNEMKVFKNATNGSISINDFVTSVTIPTRQHAVYVGDLDGDGLNDLVGISPDSVVITHNLNRPTPVVNSFTPQSGLPGSLVVLTGSNFDTNAANNNVSVNGTICSVTEASETRLTIRIPQEATSGKISVEVEGEVGSTADIFRVLKPQTIQFDSIPAQIYGIDFFVNLPQFSSAGLPITYTSSNTLVAYKWYETLKIAKAGKVMITASQAGNDIYAPAVPVKHELLIRKGTLEIEFQEDSLDGDVYVDSKPFHVHPLALAYMDEYPNWEYLPVSITSSNHQVATVKDTLVTIHGLGSSFLTFSHPGNHNYEPYQVARELIVKAKSQTIKFDPVVFNCGSTNTIDVAVSATSGLPVTLTSSNPSVASVQGHRLTVHSSGRITLIASQTGNQYYPVASPVSRELEFNVKQQSINFEQVPEKHVYEKSFQLNVSSTAALPVTVVSTDPSVATVKDNTVTIVGAGETDLIASQSGNLCFSAAESVKHKLVVSLVTSLDENLRDGEVTLYPNPTNGIITISFTKPNQTEFTNVILLDSRGATISEALIDKGGATLDLRHLPNGFYFAQIKGYQKVLFKRVMKY